jgi:hypothetical protein
MSVKPTPENDSITSLELNITDKHDQSSRNSMGVEEPFGSKDVAFIVCIPPSCHELRS